MRTIAAERAKGRTGSSTDDKPQLRREARRRRAAVDWVVAGAAIRAQLAGWLAAREPTTVLLYLATGEEASVEELAVTPGLTHRWAAPRLGGGEAVELELRRLDGTLEPHRLGFRQPGVDCTPVADGEVGVVLVPGVAFDSRGGRLGHGGGHYDRLLHRLGAVRVGVTADALVRREPLPMAAHDIPMDWLATETGVRPVVDGLSPNAARR